MPPRKPASLITRHDTKAERDARTSAESAMTPKTELSIKPPASLKGHKIATATWKRVVGLYKEIDGQIATSFDIDILVKYCQLEEECDWLAAIRFSIEQQYNAANGKLAKAKPDDMDKFNKALSQVTTLLARLQGFDARLDGKRKLLFALSQSLYLTPRSRAGVAPTEKEPQEPDDPMGQLLSE